MRTPPRQRAQRAQETTMDRDHLAEALDGALAGYRLLDHPFYRRWNEGGVSLGELRDYAAQYRHFEAMLPAHLAALSTAPGPVGEQALANLADETTHPVTHLELFDRFGSAVGAVATPPSPAMDSLLTTYADCREEGAVAGFAAVLAYEYQAAAVAATKAAGLRRHHRHIDDDALAFWDVHAAVDTDHASWALDALAHDVSEAAAVVEPATRAARAWWGFLNEREAERPRA
ncbi:MAG: iron-containing redox enzyme family protein [Candidatus Dormibacteria bacterium]